MDVPQNHPLIGCSIINHPAIGPPPIYGNLNINNVPPLFTVIHHVSSLFTIIHHY